jgi:hypothetical protein
MNFCNANAFSQLIEFAREFPAIGKGGYAFATLVRRGSHQGGRYQRFQGSAMVQKM